MPEGVEDQGAVESLQAGLNSCAAQFGSFHPQTIAAAYKLALALWSAGNANQAVGVLDRALDGLDSSLESEHPVRADLLCTLGEILLDQGQWVPAAIVYREALDLRVQHLGANHESSLAAKGDLAAVLFQLGDTTKAAQLEEEAIDDALIHLGRTHPVTCVLTWNRAQRYEESGDSDSARAIIARDLLWLLAEDDARWRETRRRFAPSSLNAWDGTLLAFVETSSYPINVIVLLTLQAHETRFTRFRFIRAGRRSSGRSRN